MSSCLLRRGGGIAYVHPTDVRLRKLQVLWLLDLLCTTLLAKLEYFPLKHVLSICPANFFQVVLFLNIISSFSSASISSSSRSSRSSSSSTV